MGIYEREQCTTPGCKGLGRSKGLRNGKRYYDNLCVTCRRHSKFIFGEQKNIKNLKCQICGWTKGPCDRHKIIPKKGYTSKNVVILCPNCHRLETLGLLKRDLTPLAIKF